MRKTSAKDRALDGHFSVLVEFLDSISRLCPQCAETRDALLYVRNVVVGNRESMRESVLAWSDNMDEPLKKGCAKYSKAVESITGSPACVYHAFSYRDGAAIRASSTSPMLRKLDLFTKFDDMNDEDKVTVWEFLDDLNKTAYEATGKETVAVPTRQDIEKNIAQRKAASAGGAPAQGQNVNDGVMEALNAVYKRHSKPALTSATDAMKAVQCAASTHASGVRARDPTAVCGVLTALRGSDAWNPKDLLTEDVESVLMALNLATMVEGIPAPMLAGIESVANKLMGDLQRGDMGGFDMQAIGKEVMAGVSPQDMTQFANSLDKIMPAISQLGGLGPSPK